MRPSRRGLKWQLNAPRAWSGREHGVRASKAGLGAEMCSFSGARSPQARKEVLHRGLGDQLAQPCLEVSAKSYTFSLESEQMWGGGGKSAGREGRSGAFS